MLYDASELTLNKKMDYSAKIKAIQVNAGVEADGIATSKTWIAIYHLLFDTVPYDLNVDSIIKAVQQQIDLRPTGYASPRTWDTLYSYILEGRMLKQDSCIDKHNQIILQSMTKEIIPFAKELIRMTKAEGICIKLMCEEANGRNFQFAKQQDENTDCCDHDFGLVFDIGIFEQASNGEYIYQEKSSLYATVAKLGESIGLTWAREKKTFTNKPLFELRPAWAVRMKEMEMITELCRRKKEKINLLAIL